MLYQAEPRPDAKERPLRSQTWDKAQRKILVIIALRQLRKVFRLATQKASRSAGLCAKAKQMHTSVNGDQEGLSVAVQLNGIFLMGAISWQDDDLHSNLSAQ